MNKIVSVLSVYRGSERVQRSRHDSLEQALQRAREEVGRPPDWWIKNGEAVASVTHPDGVLRLFIIHTEHED